MILLDSNIVIYLRDPIYGEVITEQMSGGRLATCNVIIAEVLGYRHLDQKDSHYFRDLFDSMKRLEFNDAVTNKVIELRKTLDIQLPDAIVAATAIVNDLVLWTHNLRDYKNITDLRLHDPLQ